MIKEYLIKKEETVRSFLEHSDISRNITSSIISGNGSVHVNDQVVNMSYILKENDIVKIVLPISFPNKDIHSIYHDFKILYEDSYYLIVDKENDVPCIPTIKHFEDTLANYVMSYYHRQGIIANIHFVNRLDSATSGIVILAKNSYAGELLQKQKILKEYILEVAGILKQKEGIIETGIRKSPDSIKREVYFEKINSKTSYLVLSENKDTSIIKATLHTGKTHQLRVHFAYLNHPIIGDKLYNKDDHNILHLHSFHLVFNHPILNKEINITSYPSWYQKNKHL